MSCAKKKSYTVRQKAGRQRKKTGPDTFAVIRSCIIHVYIYIYIYIEIMHTVIFMSVSVAINNTQTCSIGLLQKITKTVVLCEALKKRGPVLPLPGPH